MQPAVALHILEALGQEVLDEELLLDKLLVVPEGDEVLGGDDALAVLEDEAAHHFLLLGHDAVLSYQESGLRGWYLHIFSPTFLPPCSMFRITGQYSG